MKDRLVQYPNRYKLTEVAADVYDITPQFGNITEAGTPLNKAVLLDDATAALLCPEQTDPTVNNALFSLAPQVGDIKMTVRHITDDKWLLCDGSLIVGDQYPILSTYLEEAGLTGAWGKVEIDSTVEIKSIDYKNEVLEEEIPYERYWVAVGSKGSNGIIFWRQGYSPYGVWTSIMPSGAGVFNSVRMQGADEADGLRTYIIAAGEQDTGVWYKMGRPNETPGNVWTQVHGLSGGVIGAIEVSAGQWYMTGTLTDDTPVLYRAYDGGLDTWTYITVPIYGYALHHANGYWVLCGGTSTGDGALYYATDPTSSWTKANVATRSTIRGIFYADGYWVAVSHGTGTFYPTRGGGIHYATAPNGTWTTNYQTKAGGGKADFNSVSKAGSYWAACDTLGSIWLSTSPTAPVWTENKQQDAGTLNSILGRFDGITEEIYWIAGGGNGMLLTSSEGMIKLPDLTSGVINGYIRAD